jgi:hypothetical protein
MIITLKERSSVTMTITLARYLLNLAIWLGRKNGRRVLVYGDNTGFTMEWFKPDVEEE